MKPKPQFLIVFVTVLSAFSQAFAQDLHRPIFKRPSRFGQPSAPTFQRPVHRPNKNPEARPFTQPVTRPDKLPSQQPAQQPLQPPTPVTPPMPALTSPLSSPIIPAGTLLETGVAAPQPQIFDPNAIGVPPRRFNVDAFRVNPDYFWHAALPQTPETPDYASFAYPSRFSEIEDCYNRDIELDIDDQSSPDYVLVTFNIPNHNMEFTLGRVHTVVLTSAPSPDRDSFIQGWNLGGLDLKQYHQLKIAKDRLWQGSNRLKFNFLKKLGGSHFKHSVGCGSVVISSFESQRTPTPPRGGFNTRLQDPVNAMSRGIGGVPDPRDFEALGLVFDPFALRHPAIVDMNRIPIPRNGVGTIRIPLAFSIHKERSYDYLALLINGHLYDITPVIPGGWEQYVYFDITDEANLFNKMNHFRVVGIKGNRYSPASSIMKSENWRLDTGGIPTPSAEFFIEGLSASGTPCSTAKVCDPGLFNIYSPSTGPTGSAVLAHYPPIYIFADGGYCSYHYPFMRGEKYLNHTNYVRDQIDWGRDEQGYILGQKILYEDLSGRCANVQLPIPTRSW